MTVVFADGFEKYEGLAPVFDEDEMDFYQFKKQVRRLVAVVAIPAAVFGVMVGATFPLYRTVHEKKIITTVKKTEEVIEKTEVDLTSGCMQGKSGIVRKVHSEAYDQSSKEDPEGWIWKSFLTIKMEDDTIIMCDFSGVDMSKTIQVGDKIALAGGERR